MAQRRSGQYPTSWGAGSRLANTNITECKASSYNATFEYTPARAAGAPPISRACKSEMHFSVLAPTSFGQNVYILGNTTLLGNDLNNVSAIILPLGTGNITADAPYWDVDIWLPAGQTFEYQYVLQDTRTERTQDWIFENITRTVRNSACSSGQIVMTHDVNSFPASDS
jgi:glucoamylase